jgi:hypothetical protein
VEQEERPVAPPAPLTPATGAAAWGGSHAPGSHASWGQAQSPGQGTQAPNRARNQAPEPAPHQEPVTSIADPEFWSDDHERRRPGWLAPVLLGVAGVLLILTAYGIGKVVSSGVDGNASSASEDEQISLPENPDNAVGDKKNKPAQKKYRGPVGAAAIGGATASCQSASSVDAAGNPVTYEPAKAYDGDQTTAWRCDGSGSGETFTVSLPEETTLGEVGLVPGYAKTDANSGEDRYAENNRITKVRWVFSDGSEVVQKMDGSATNRDLRKMRIPKTTADEVTIEILDSVKGPRNTVAISEIWLGATRG